MLHFSKKIILASASPRRSILMKQMGIDCMVEASEIDEIFNDELSPQENAQWLAFQKAESVAKKHQNAIIIGADTIVVVEGKVFGKPKNFEEAKRMLAALSGRTHSVYTGYTIIDMPSRETISSCEQTEVTFRNMNEEEIDFYVATGSPMDKAGAYGIQDDIGAVFIEKINGDFYTVVGLPVCKVYESLKRFSTSMLLESNKENF